MFKKKRKKDSLLSCYHKPQLSSFQAVNLFVFNSPVFDSEHRSTYNHWF